MTLTLALANINGKVKVVGEWYFLGETESLHV